MEPGLCFGSVDVVGACDQAVGGIDFGWEMPGYESAVAVSVGLGIGVAEGGLSTKIHVAEKELAY